MVLPAALPAWILITGGKFGRSGTEIGLGRAGEDQREAASGSMVLIDPVRVCRVFVRLRQKTFAPFAAR